MFFPKRVYFRRILDWILLKGYPAQIVWNFSNLISLVSCGWDGGENKQAALKRRSFIVVIMGFLGIGVRYSDFNNGNI